MKYIFSLLITLFTINSFASQKDIKTEAESQSLNQIKNTIYATDILPSFPNDLKKIVFDYINPNFENKYNYFKDEVEKSKASKESLIKIYRELQAFRSSCQKEQFFNSEILQNFVNLECRVHNLIENFAYGLVVVEKEILRLNEYLQGSDVEILNKLTNELNDFFNDRDVDLGILKGTLEEFCLRLILKNNNEVLKEAINLIIKLCVCSNYIQSSRQTREQIGNDLNDHINLVLTQKGESYYKIIYDHLIKSLNFESVTRFCPGQDKF